MVANRTIVNEFVKNYQARYIRETLKVSSKRKQTTRRIIKRNIAKLKSSIKEERSYGFEQNVEACNGEKWNGRRKSRGGNRKTGG